MNTQHALVIDRLLLVSGGIVWRWAGKENTGASPAKVGMLQKLYIVEFCELLMASKKEFLSCYRRQRLS